MSTHPCLEKNTAIRSSISKLCLSTAILTILGVPALAQQVVADGTNETAPANTNIHTTAAYANGSGLWALNGGTITAAGPISILTEGSYASGIVAATGGIIDVTGARIETLGDGALGIEVSGTGSAVTASNSSIETSGYYSIGASAHTSELVLDNVNVTTNGMTSHGVSADYSGTVTMNAGSVTTNDMNAYGLLSTQTDALLTANDVKATTNGERAVGAAAVQGGTLHLNGGEIATFGDNASGVLAAYGATTVEINGTKIRTYGSHADTGSSAVSGTGSVGVYATDAADVSIRRADIETAGTLSHAVQADRGSTLTIADSNLATTGLTGYGVRLIGSGTSADIARTNIEAKGDNARGIIASEGASFDAENVTIKTTGTNSFGINTQHAGSRADLSKVSVTTTGVGSHGLFVNSGSAVDAVGLAVATDGEAAHGLLVQGVDSTLNVGKADGTANKITTTGEGSIAIRAANGGVANVAYAMITVDGNNAAGASASSAGSQVDLANSNIVTVGDGSAGAFAENGGKLAINGSIIQTTGYGADGVSLYTDSSAFVGDTKIVASGYGVQAFENNAVTVADSYIETTGEYTAGVSVGINSHADISGSTVKASHYTALMSGDATMNVANSSIIGSGTASALMTWDARAASDSANNIVLDNSVLQSEQVAAVQVIRNASEIVARNGTQIVGNGGTLLETWNGVASLVADGNVRLYGDMMVNHEWDDLYPDLPGNIHVSLKNGSYWNGAGTEVTTLALDATSRWKMTGSSDVGSLVNDGVVDFDAANSYKTLTVGSLAVNEGSFILNTRLNEGGMASETDRIVVKGDATGNGFIHVKNNGGAGAFTGTGATDGIRIVEVGGASDAEFKLGSAAIVGIYDYQLKKADGQNWYLQTEGSDVVDPVTGNPGTGNPGTGHVVDIVPGYNIALSAAQNHVLTTLDTFHERLGELRAEELNDGYHAWMRGIGKTGSYSPKSITGYNGHGFDMTTAGVQIGADYSKSDVFVAGDKFTVGIFGEYANSSFDVRGRTADGSISSKGLGGYVTWQQKAPTDRKPGTGAYVDAVVKQDWLDFGVSAKSVSGFDLQNGYKGKATTASIEAGYGFDLGNNVVFQPQAQLTWSKVKADSFTDSYGIAVHGQEAESLIGRVGLRLEKTFYFGGEEETIEAAPTPAAKVQKQVKGKNGKNAKAMPAAVLEAPKKKFVKSVTTYADANVKHEFKGKNGLVASNTGIGNDMGGTRYDVGVGMVARVSENVSLFGRGAVEFGGSTNVAGKVSGGLKITW